MSHAHQTCGNCRSVVLRTYREMRDCGSDDPAAFRSALQVLILRHPERAYTACRDDVSDWIADHLDTPQQQN